MIMTAATLPVRLRTEAKQDLSFDTTGHEYQKVHTEKRLFEQLWDQVNKNAFPVTQLGKCSHLSTYILFVEGLGAAASLVGRVGGARARAPARAEDRAAVERGRPGGVRAPWWPAPLRRLGRRPTRSHHAPLRCAYADRLATTPWRTSFENHAAA